MRLQDSSSNCRGPDCPEHFCGKSGVLQQEEKKTVVRAGGAAGEREGETKWKQVAGRESPFELQQSLSPAHRIFDRR
jgi:hypothetical protein